MSSEAEKKEAVIADYRKKLLKHKEIDTKVRSLREAVKELKKDYDKTEDDLKALQSVGQIIGEVLRQLDEERCESGASLTYPNQGRALMAFTSTRGPSYGSLQPFGCWPRGTPRGACAGPQHRVHPHYTTT